MKKIFFAFILVFALLVGGCSCNDPAVLSFGNDWNNGRGASVGMKEILTYDVSFDDDFTSGSYNFEKDSALDGVEYSFENGKYVQTLTVLDYRASIPNESSSLVEEIRATETNTILMIESKFTVTAKYDCGDAEEDKFTSEDYVNSVVYFSGGSFMPIYSKTENYFSHLVLSGGKYTVETTHNTKEVLYEKTSYTVNSEYFDTSEESGEEPQSEKDSETFNYTYKTAIDNAELLFALRGMSLRKDSTSALSTVSPNYGQTQTLNVRYYDDQEIDLFGFSTDGGEPTDATVNARCVSFVLAPSGAGCTGCMGGTTTGTAQLVFLENRPGEEVQTVSDRSLVVRYVTPLTAIDGTYSRMGALVYNLEDVTVIYPGS